MTWDIVSHPTESVSILYRLEDGTFYYSNSATRDSGTIDSDTLPAGGVYKVWLRPETATEVGEWQEVMAITDASLDSDAEVVYFEGSVVYHGTDVVIYS